MNNRDELLLELGDLNAKLLAIMTEQDKLNAQYDALIIERKLLIRRMTSPALRPKIKSSEARGPQELATLFERAKS